jgi:hypothetical protein
MGLRPLGALFMLLKAPNTVSDLSQTLIFQTLDCMACGVVRTILIYSKAMRSTNVERTLWAGGKTSLGLRLEPTISQCAYYPCVPSCNAREFPLVHHQGRAKVRCRAYMGVCYIQMRVCPWLGDRPCPCFSYYTIISPRVVWVASKCDLKYVLLTTNTDLEMELQNLK